MAELRTSVSGLGEEESRKLRDTLPSMQLKLPQSPTYSHSHIHTHTLTWRAAHSGLVTVGMAHVQQSYDVTGATHTSHKQQPKHTLCCI